MENYDNGFLKNSKRKILVDGILSKIGVSKVEKPQFTYFGSSDRKTYTVKITLTYLDEKSTFLIDVSPWQEKQEDFLNELVDKAKHKFADEIYEKLYENL